jgi:hypothetical protein
VLSLLHCSILEISRPKAVTVLLDKSQGRRGATMVPVLGDVARRHSTTDGACRRKSDGSRVDVGRSVLEHSQWADGEGWGAHCTQQLPLFAIRKWSSECPRAEAKPIVRVKALILPKQRVRGHDDGGCGQGGQVI